MGWVGVAKEIYQHNDILSERKNFTVKPDFISGTAQRVKSGQLIGEQNYCWHAQDTVSMI